MKRVKEITVLWIFLVGFIAFSVSAQESSNELTEEKSFNNAVTEISSVLNENDDQQSSEKPKYRKLKIRPFTRKNSGFLAGKSEDGGEDSNDSVEYSTKIQVIEEIRTVTEAPIFTKKLIPKLKIKKVEKLEENDESNVDVDNKEENSVVKETFKEDNKEINQEPAQQFTKLVRPTFRPVLTTSKKPSFEVNFSESSNPDESTTRKRYVRKKYKKIDYKNGTIEKIYVGPAVEIDPLVKQPKIEVANLPKPVLTGRTTVRARLTPKSFIGRTTSEKPFVPIQKVDSKKDSDEKVSASPKLLSLLEGRRTGLSTFGPIGNRKFIKRLKSIRERPTTTTTTTTELPLIDNNEEDEVVAVKNDLEEPKVEIEKNEQLPSNRFDLDENEESNEITTKKTTTPTTTASTTTSTTTTTTTKTTTTRAYNTTPKAETQSRTFLSRGRGSVARLNARPVNTRVAQEANEDNIEKVTGSGRRVQSRPSLGTSFVSRQRVQVEQPDRATQSFTSRRRITSRPQLATTKSENESSEKLKEVNKSAVGSNFDLLKRRTELPSSPNRFSARRTTESTSTVETTTKAKIDESKIEEEEKVVTELPEESDESVTELPENVEESDTLKTSTTTLPSSTTDKTTTLKSTTTLKPTTTTFKTTPKRVLSTYKPFKYSTTETSTSQQEDIDTTTILLPEVKEYNRFVQTTHKQVIEEFVSTLPGFKSQPSTTKLTTTTRLPSRSKSTTTTTKKPTTTTTVRTTTKQPTRLQTQTATPLVHFIIQDDSVNSLHPSRILTPLVPDVSNTFRELTRDPPSRLVQQLPFGENKESNIKVNNDFSSASRFKVTSAPVTTTYSAPTGRRQPPRYTASDLIRTPPPLTTTSARSFETTTISRAEQFKNLENEVLSQGPQAQQRSQVSSTPISKSTTTTTVPRTIQTTKYSKSQNEVVSKTTWEPLSNREFVNHFRDASYVKPAPKSGPNRGRGGARFNEYELKWNKEIWSLDGEDEGHYNFIKV